ncbi:MAG: type 2 isopentenyl-diphosphate Delta-isomerase [Desulfurococcaceae archaeon]
MDEVHIRRKLEHIGICLKEDTTFENNCKELFDEIILIHQALPGVDYNEVDLSTEFLGYELKAPLVIEAITGGHVQVKAVNEKLAMIANEYGISIGTGSQRPILTSNFSDEVIETYRVVRERARDVPVIGNIGITQIRLLSVEDVKRLVDSIQADALAIHLNPAQELVQPEGDRNFKKDILLRIADLVKELGIPIMVKEVGNGLSMETIKSFQEMGVRIFDVAGACGTNWVKVEAYRNPEKSLLREVGLSLSNHKWGIPTPLSLIESRAASPDSTIIASGGVWNGIYAAKMFALGADLAGFARPILKALVEHGYEGARKYLERYIAELRAVVFLAGAENVRELRAKPIVLGPRLVGYMSARGINVEDYIKKTRRGAIG